MRQWVEIVAEETTSRHLSGGDKPEEGMPDMIVGASYAGAAAIAKNLCWQHDEHLIEDYLWQSTSSHT